MFYVIGIEYTTGKVKKRFSKKCDFQFFLNNLWENKLKFKKYINRDT